MVVAGVRVAIAMLEEKKANSQREKKRPLKFCIEEFLSAGMFCARCPCLRTLYESAQASMPL